MPKALKVTENNLDYVVAYADQFNADVSHISTALEIAQSHEQALYVVHDGEIEHKNVCFATYLASEFFRKWMFPGDSEDLSQFKDVARNV